MGFESKNRIVAARVRAMISFLIKDKGLMTHKHKLGDEFCQEAAENSSNRETIRFAIALSSLGHVLVAQSGQGVCAILMGDDPQELTVDLEKCFPKANLIGADFVLENTVVTKVISFVEAPGNGLDLQLDLYGTAFQLRVWQALREISLGKTVSYSELAQAIGQPRATRAVAMACGANKIAVAIPCHRVVRNDGGLSGYRWGVERKRLLLEREVGFGSTK